LRIRTHSASRRRLGEDGALGGVPDRRLEVIYARTTTNLDVITIMRSHDPSNGEIRAT